MQPRPSERGGRLAPRREAQARCRRCGERNSPAKSERANSCMVQASKPNERESRAIEARIKESNPHRVTKVKRRRHRMEAERSKRDGRPPRAVRAPRLHSLSPSPSPSLSPVASGQERPAAATQPCQVVVTKSCKIARKTDAATAARKLRRAEHAEPFRCASAGSRAATCVE